MSRRSSPGVALVAAAAALVAARPAAAQPVAKDAARARAPLCAAGVRKYESWPEVPTPFDTLRLPPGEPVRVTSPEEAQAAEQKLLERAASIGANGIVVSEESSGGGDMMQVRRRVTAVFVHADSARAYKACAR